jgi:O-antigen ligase
MLFVLGLSLLGSGFSALRFEFIGLKVHPYLVVVGAFFPLLAITRLHLIPPRHLIELTAFAALYFGTTIPGGVDIREGVKIFSAVVTIITMAMLVRGWDNFVAGTLGMCLAVGVLAARGLDVDVEDLQSGVDAMQEANRNTYSLYALPAIFLGSYILVRNRRDPILVKALLAVTVFAAVLAICLNLNRSGWLGLVVIALLLIRERSTKAAVVLAAAAAAVLVLLTTVYTAEHVQTRIAETRGGLMSDSFRVRLVVTSFEIGLENPLLGVSPQELPFILARQVGDPSPMMATHNVFAHVVAGSGIAALVLLFHIGYLFAVWQPPKPHSAYSRMLFKEAQRVLRMVLILWVVRGTFTHEIIYSPAFCMAIGLALGLELSTEAAAAAPRYAVVRRRPRDRGLR